MTRAVPGDRRAYNPGEDLVKAREGVIVCQGPGAMHTVANPRQGICGRPTRKVGRYRIVGGWHDVYECEPPTPGWKTHRFGLKGTVREEKGGATRSSAPWGDVTVIDVAIEKPTFG